MRTTLLNVAIILGLVVSISAKSLGADRGEIVSGETKTGVQIIAPDYNFLTRLAKASPCQL